MKQLVAVLLFLGLVFGGTLVGVPTVNADGGINDLHYSVGCGEGGTCDHGCNPPECNCLDADCTCPDITFTGHAQFGEGNSIDFFYDTGGGCKGGCAWTLTVTCSVKCFTDQEMQNPCYTGTHNWTGSQTSVLSGTANFTSSGSQNSTTAYSRMSWAKNNGEHCPRACILMVWSNDDQECGTCLYDVVPPGMGLNPEFRWDWLALGQ